MAHWFYIALSVILTSIGQLFFKKGMLILSHNHPQASLGKLMLLALVNSQVLLGFFSFGAGAVLWLGVLAREEVSYAYPLSSLGYIIVLIGSYFLFHEHLSLSRVIGILLLIAGAVFIEYSR
ncbi:MAG: EamA family transporter [Thermodesulfobacteriota bacterium]